MIPAEGRINDVLFALDVGSVLVYSVLRVFGLALLSFGNAEHVTAQMELGFAEIGDWLAKNLAHVFD